MSLDFNIVSTQLTKAALSFFYAVSMSYVMLSVVFTVLPRFERIYPALNCVHDLLHITSIILMRGALESL